MYMEENGKDFYTLEKDSKEQAIKTKKQENVLIWIILFLVSLVVLEIGRAHV